MGLFDFDSKKVVTESNHIAVRLNNLAGYTRFGVLTNPKSSLDKTIVDEKTNKWYYYDSKELTRLEEQLKKEKEQRIKDIQKAYELQKQERKKVEVKEAIEERKRIKEWYRNVGKNNKAYVTKVYHSDMLFEDVLQHCDVGRKWFNEHYIDCSQF